jgi:hypothetical protein
VPSSDEIYFPKRELGQKIYYNISVTLCDKCQSYCIVNNWLASFRTGYLSNEDEQETNSSDNSRKQGCHSFHDPGQLKNML